MSIEMYEYERKRMATMIRHDDKWQQTYLPTFLPGSLHSPSSAQVAASDFAESYHEHMRKWRSVDERPAIGQRVEVLEKNEHGDPATYSWISNGELSDIAIAWRPADLGELPDEFDLWEAP